ncbi:hypothetical protein [Aliivibrio wodanis]|uniref:hypothetical protein n=1 Tax=Aliivibrio wodanis TaxID=80852 RepID=UPI00406CDCE1
MRTVFILLGFIPSFVIAAPFWYDNLELKSNQYIGSGLGESIGLAKQEAIKQISFSLSSTISSSLNETIKTVGNSGTMETQSSTEMVNKSVLLPKITWEHIEAEHGIYYAQGRVDKADVITLYENTLKVQSKKFDYLLGQKQIDLSDYLVITQSSEALKTHLIQATTIMSESEIAKNEYNKVMSIFDKQNAYKNTMCMSVAYKGHSSFERKMLQPSIESAIQNSGLKLKSGSSCESVTFNSNSTTSKTNGTRTESVKIHISLGSPAIASKVISVIGSSSGSKKAAMSDVASKFSSHFDQRNNLVHYLLNSNKAEITIQ